MRAVKIAGITLREPWHLSGWLTTRNLVDEIGRGLYLGFPTSDVHWPERLASQFALVALCCRVAERSYQAGRDDEWSAHDRPWELLRSLVGPHPAEDVEA